MIQLKWDKNPCQCQIHETDVAVTETNFSLSTNVGSLHVNISHGTWEDKNV